ncbi:MAG: ABC transporter ATP-binding protein [Verrucomicrobia bacterium]|nr:ABC transporter ATP-binding protein [Verrucomicrobiota bacterium]
MLEVRNIDVHYGAIAALREVSLKVAEGTIATLIGGNGAGKTTTLRAISGMVRPSRGQIFYEGKDITGIPPHRLLGRGLAHCPEGRMVFANLTVRENLRMGAFLQRDRAVIAREEEFVFGLFPRLEERESQLAGTLSGGEQQMLAISRALMGQPRCLLLDEPSLGIAPLLVRTIFEKIVELNRVRKLTILLVEQSAHRALEISHDGYVLETGRILLADRAEALRNNEKVRDAYLGA